MNRKIFFQGLEYYEVISKTGRIWLDRNIGAEKVADSPDDKWSYGKYYTFDEIICPAGYRLPTISEWEDEINSWDTRRLYGAIFSPLRLPAAGFRRSLSDALEDIAIRGHYWADDLNGNNCRILIFSDKEADIYQADLISFNSVRLIRNK